MKLTKDNHEVIKHPKPVCGYTVKVVIDKGPTVFAEKAYFYAATKSEALKRARDYLKNY